MQTSVAVLQNASDPRNASEAENSFRMLPVLTMLIGAMIVGVGILLLPESRSGGDHIVAIGLSPFCSGPVVTRWATDRFTLRPTDQRRWSMAFAVLAGILLVLFVSINRMTFGEGQLGSEDFEEVGRALSAYRLRIDQSTPTDHRLPQRATEPVAAATISRPHGERSTELEPGRKRCRTPVS